VPGVSYKQFVIPGVLIQAVMVASMRTGVAVSQDSNAGMTDRFRSLPIARSAVLAARTIADQAVNLAALAAIIALGVPLGFQFRGSAPALIAALALLMLLGYALTWLYAAIGMALKDPEAADAAGTVTLFLLLFSSSAFVPISTMPGWLQPIARAQPVTVTINAVRALVNGLPAQHWPWQSLAWSAAILLLSASSAILQYRSIAK